jgi:DNA invertase Pin-like site-specific DNA recombinase
MRWWEINTGPAIIRPKAVAYYRHSAQDRQENSIPIQRENVRKWADEHGLEIIKEFEEAGKSGLNAEGRPAFTDMMENWVKKRDDFSYIICLDVSRWGRFQDLDLSAQYSAECKTHGKLVIYVNLGKPNDGDTFYPVHVTLERFRAAEYSKELSKKVWDGCATISRQGYWAGGPPPLCLAPASIGRTPGARERLAARPAEEHSEPTCDVGHGRPC